MQSPTSLASRSCKALKPRTNWQGAGAVWAAAVAGRAKLARRANEMTRRFILHSKNVVNPTLARGQRRDDDYSQMVQRQASGFGSETHDKRGPPSGRPLLTASGELEVFHSTRGKRCWILSRRDRAARLASPSN